MLCANEFYSYSIDCFWTKKESHWFWLLIPVVLIICCVFYIFSRPNYTRLTTRTYQTFNATKNAISFNPQKQHNETFDQYRNDLTPTSSLSRNVFEQGESENNGLMHADRTKYKTIQQVNNHSNILTASNYSSMNNNSSDRVDQYKVEQFNWNETKVRVDIGARFQLNHLNLLSDALKSTVYEVERECSLVPIGMIFYPLEHLFIDQCAKGHLVRRDLLPGKSKQWKVDYLDLECVNSTAMSLVDIQADVWYDPIDGYLNIRLHSLRAVEMLHQVYHVYVHASMIKNTPIFPSETHKCSPQMTGPIVPLEGNTSTIYPQLFRFLVHHDELHTITLVLDIYHHSLNSTFLDDILLGRTIIISPDMSFSAMGQVNDR